MHSEEDDMESPILEEEENEGEEAGSEDLAPDES